MWTLHRPQSQAKSVKPNLSQKKYCGLQRLTYQSAEKINKDKEPHREAAEPEKFWEKNQLAQVMDCGINPTTTLREQDTEGLWCDCTSDSIGNEFRLECREVFHQ